MLYPITQILESLLVVMAGTFVATPLLLFNIRIAPRLGLIDWPKARGVAEEQIPIIGHSLVLLTLFILSSLHSFAALFPDRFSGQFVPSTSFIVTAAILAIMGHFDDRRPLPAIDKLFFQFVCALFVVFLDPQLRASIGERYGVQGSFWAVFFLIGLMNAINFIDGVDGLAGLVLGMGAAGLFLLNSGSSHFLSLHLLSTLFVGMIIPFLYVNVLKRKGFLGNVGSYFFAYVLGVLHLALSIDTTGPISRMALSGLCFIVPLADGITVITLRLFSGRSPFQADKGHLHHRLVQSGLPLRWALFNFGLISLAGLSVAYAVIGVDGMAGSYLPVVSLVSILGITSTLIVLVEKTSKRRVQLYLSLLEQGDILYCLKYKVVGIDGKPISNRQLRRLEARINTEVRISDLCFYQEPDTLIVALKTVAEPLRGIATRLDQIFQSETPKLIVTVVRAEFTKIQQPVKAATFLRKSA